MVYSMRYYWLAIFCMGFFSCFGHIVDNADFTAMSINCYAFQADITAALNVFSKNLMENTEIDVWSRINKIAIFIKKQIKRPDVIMFQELWLDENKEHMIELLEDLYPYHYYVPRLTSDHVKDFYTSLSNFVAGVKNSSSGQEALKKLFSSESLEQLNPIKVDSGLLIVSRYPIDKMFNIVFNERKGDEKHAHKGALFVQTYDKNGLPICVVTTHLQTWYPDVRFRQMELIGETLNLFISAEKSMPIILMGDLNEEIYYDKEEKMVIDFTASLVRAINLNNKYVFYNPITELLARSLMAEKIAFLDSLKHHYVIKTLSDGQSTLVDHIPVYTGYDYFVESTSREGTAMLDQVLTSTDLTCLGFHSYRKEILSDDGKNIRFNKKTALSDHSAVIAFFKRNIL